MNRTIVTKQSLTHDESASCPPTSTTLQEIRGNILVVDDENGPRQSLRILLMEDYDVFLAQDVDTALQVVCEHPIDLIITDLRMPRKSGVDLLKTVKEAHPDIEVIILTGYGQLATAMKAVEYGAFAYLEKPFDNDKVARLVHDGVHKRRRELERQQMERLALDANRFGTFNRIVSGLIHDLGTPLSVIGSHIELMTIDPEKTTEPDRLQVMHSQVQYCCDIVRSTMSFLRQQSHEFALSDLNEIVATCLDVAQPLMRKHCVTLRTNLVDDCPPFRGGFVLVRQAILNLIVNACQAMDMQKGPRELEIGTRVQDDMICLTVSDTGSGIPEEVGNQIFDVFYSSKKGIGTGLGLAVVTYVMEEHKGEVTVSHNEKGGALFTLLFPIAQ